jgi:RNA polymerase sigma-70 factor (ECF subfamily)
MRLLKGTSPTADSSAKVEPVGTDDLRLVDAVLRKDRKATAELVALHADAVYAYIFHRLAPRTDLVDDIVQEVFLAAWENLSKYQGTSPLRGWLLGIARHKVEDYYRARLREPLPIETVEEEPSTIPALESNFEEMLDRKFIGEKVRQVLRSLPEGYSLALLWRYWMKRSAREIAGETGKTEKAVERLLARAREQFRKRWGDE